MEQDTVATHVRELEVAATTNDGELGVVVRAARSLKIRLAMGEDRANQAELRASETLDKTFELGALVMRLNRTAATMWALQSLSMRN